MPSAITVIVVAYHGDRWIPECLTSLRDSLDMPIRLVLVDNVGNSCIESVAVEGLDPIVLRCNEPLGFAEANNFALQQIDWDTEAVCFLNQDTTSGEGWLTACVECLRRDPQLGAVSPMIRTYDWQDWDPAFRDCAKDSPQLVREMDSDAEGGSHDEPCYEVPQITAAAMVIRTSILGRVGPFDPIFGSYFEDYDLCRRIGEAGSKLGICTGGEIAHFSGSATTDDATRRKRTRQMLRNRAIHRFRLAGKHRTGAALKYFGHTFPRNLLRSLLRTPSSQPLGPYLAAHRDLLPLLGRLLSRHRDLRLWTQYLRDLGWPGERLNPAPTCTPDVTLPEIS